MSDDQPNDQPEERAEVSTATEQSAPEPREYTHRRAPKYGSFIFTGVVVGALVTTLLYWRLTPGDRGQLHLDGVVGYLGFTLVIIGGVLGAALALLIERRTERGRNRRSGRR
jgi:hypothetical protein